MLAITSFVLDPASGPAGTSVNATVTYTVNEQLPPVTLTLRGIISQDGQSVQAEAPFNLTFPAPGSATVQVVDPNAEGWQITPPTDLASPATFVCIAPGA